MIPMAMARERMRISLATCSRRSSTSPRTWLRRRVRADRRRDDGHPGPRRDRADRRRPARARRAARHRLLVALAAAAAILGDNVGFAIGRKGGRRLFARPGPFHRHRLGARARRAVLRPPRAEGGVPRALGVRAAIASAWLAGMNKMAGRRSCSGTRSAGSPGRRASGSASTSSATSPSRSSRPPDRPPRWPACSRSSRSSSGGTEGGRMSGVERLTAADQASSRPACHLAFHEVAHPEDIAMATAGHRPGADRRRSARTARSSPPARSPAS